MVLVVADREVRGPLGILEPADQFRCLGVQVRPIEGFVPESLLDTAAYELR